MNTAQIIDAVVQQTGTDASRATILGPLNECYSSQVSDARWNRTQETVDTTAAGQGTYDCPIGLVESYGLRVGGATYDPVGEDILWQLQNGEAYLNRTRAGGVFSETFTSDGTLTIALWPIPDTGGAAIEMYAARLPADLTDSSASSPITPTDSHGSLIDGTSAIILLRIDERPDLAAPFQARYDAETEKLRRRKNAQLRGSYPVRMLISGRDF